jgi:osmoprotectant transport system permease protein
VLSDLFDFFGSRGDDLIELTIASFELILIVAALATVLSVLAALTAYRRPRIAKAMLSVFSVFLTIPSFALFGLFIPIFGLGSTAAIVALVMYSLLPITRNAIVGLQAVDPAIIDAAKGMGMSRNRVLWRIELPLAWPVIITGIRVAVQIVVGISAIAAFLNVEGLGTFIFRGLSTIGGANALNFTLSGTVLLVVVGLVLDGALLLFSRLTTSRGIRV